MYTIFDIWNNKKMVEIFQKNLFFRKMSAIILPILKNGGHFSEKFIFPKNVRHFFIFTYIKNRMIYAIAINILN